MNSIKFHETAYKEKNNFLKFIYDLGENNFKDLFKYPRSDFSLWWFSLIAEKATLRNNSYTSLINALIKNELHSDRESFGLNDYKKFFSSFIMGVVAILRLIVKCFIAKLGIKNFRGRRRSLKNCKYLIVSYFPHPSKEHLQENLFIDSYLPSYHHQLETEHKLGYGFLGIYADIGGRSYNDAIELINKFSKDQNVFLLEEFMNWRSVLELLLVYIYFSFLFLINLRSISSKVIYTQDGNNYQVWHLFRDDFFSSFCGPHLVASLKYIVLFKAALKNIHKNTKVVSVCEMLWWEKALYIYAKKYKLVTIGSQHTIVPELMMNYFNYPLELVDRNFIKCAPVPDLLATVGPLTRNMFVKNGWSEDKVFIWGAQRFSDIKENSSHSKPLNKRSAIFVCALSLSERESLEILLWCQKAFKIGLSYKVVIKSHPGLNANRLIEKNNIKLDPDLFSLVESDLGSIINGSLGMLVTASSSSFFGLASVTPVIVLRLENDLDLNPLSYLSSLPYYVYSPEELRATCDRIASTGITPEYRSDCQDFLQNYLYFPNNESEYLQKIDAINTRSSNA